MIAGLVAGVIALLAALLLFWPAGALSAAAQASGQSIPVTLAATSVLLATAGAFYGRIFMRAANDFRGGWLFGISYGFLLWMIGPASLLQWLLHKPLAIGRDSQFIFLSLLLYGLTLGSIFPFIHRLFIKDNHLKSQSTPLQGA